MTGLAGCLSSSDTPTDSAPETESGPGFDTPPTGECDPVDLPTSGPTKGGLEPVEYPDFPGEVTDGTARSFARDFEYAYRRNEFVKRHEDTWYDELTVDVENAELTDERGEGYVVRTDGETTFAVTDRPETATGTARPTGRGPFTTWFYLTDRYAIRYENSEAEEPNFEHGEIVACAE